MFAKLTASIALGSNCTIEATIFDLVDCNNPAQMKQMSQALKTLIQGDVSKQLSVTPSAPAKFQKSAGSEEFITDSQLDYLRKLLRENSISEEDFCKKHSAGKLEDLSKKNAQVLIKDLSKQK